MTFIHHFMDRFIEMASCDMDFTVSLEMISTMRILQRQGFLDTVNEEKLDMIDILIFDPETTSEIRKEALLFMMDHTEGFDSSYDENYDFLQEEVKTGYGGKSEGKKLTGRKGGASSNRKGLSATSSLERMKNIAVQLETLTEFAEHCLSRSSASVSSASTALEWSYLLAEACLLTEKAGILYDWNTGLTLLLKEGEGDISEGEDLMFENDEEGDEKQEMMRKERMTINAVSANTLRSLQVNILLKMIVVTAKKVNTEKCELEEAEESGSSLHSYTMEEKVRINNRYDSLNFCLGKKLPLLLMRFKDDESNLSLLSELLSYCRIDHITKSNSSLLKYLNDIFLRSLVSASAGNNNELLLRNILLSLKGERAKGFESDVEGIEGDLVRKKSQQKKVLHSDSGLHSSISLDILDQFVPPVLSTIWKNILDTFQHFVTLSSSAAEKAYKRAGKRSSEVGSVLISCCTFSYPFIL
jgi:hypothetical protein